MNTLRNKVQLIGNIGKTPEVKTLANGNMMAKFSIATNESYKNKKGEYVDNVQWHNIVCWGNTAKLAEKLLEKGKQVALEGKISSYSYEDKDGNKRFVTEVVAEEFLLLSKKEK
ncbi:MAG: single-stranded DNA-binding protein [Bacteroidota bacterium]